MKFDELLQIIGESISPNRNFYHITSISNANQIAKRNKFVCSFEGEKNFQYISNKEYAYHISLARNPSSEYFDAYFKYNESESCIIEIDGSKLSDHGYPIRPIDFYRRRGSKKHKREQEDRLFSKNHIINNFLQYIKAFHVCKEAIIGDSILKKQQRLDINVIFSSGKPVYIYNTLNDLKILNRTKRTIMQELLPE